MKAIIYIYAMKLIINNHVIFKLVSYFLIIFKILT
jgi:hypothetical protein